MTCDTCCALEDLKQDLVKNLAVIVCRRCGHDKSLQDAAKRPRSLQDAANRPQIFLRAVPPAPIAKWRVLCRYTTTHKEEGERGRLLVEVLHVRVRGDRGLEGGRHPALLDRAPVDARVEGVALHLLCRT